MLGSMDELTNELKQLIGFLPTLRSSVIKEQFASEGFIVKVVGDSLLEALDGVVRLLESDLDCWSDFAST